MKSLGITLALVLLAGCTAGDGGSDEPTPPPTSSRETPTSVADGLPTDATRVWSRKLEVLGEPTPAGDVLVAVAAARGDELDVVALDREDGTVRWRRPLMVLDSTVGAYVGELVHESADGDAYVVMQEAPTGGALRAGLSLPYLALDPATGEELARTRPVTAQFGAPACDDGIDACLRITPDERFEETRWVLGSWKLRPERGGLPAGANSVVEGSDVYLISGTVRQYRAATAVGRPGSDAWRRPQARVTGSKRWLLDDTTAMVDEEAGVAVLQLLGTPQQKALDAYERGRTVRLDQTERRTVGVDLESGEILWRHDGADIRCLELTRSDLPVRCAFTGSRAYQEDREPRLERSRGFLEGYDPSTGETTWRQELDRAAVSALTLEMNEMDAAVDAIEDADDLVVVATPEGHLLLSLRDGSTREVSDDEPLLCSTAVPYRHRFDTVASGVVDGFGETRARTVLRPCDATGKDSGGRPEATALLTGGVDAGEGLVVIARRGTVDAYLLS